MLKTEAIQKFLQSQPYPWCKLYTPDMEVQVNVHKSNGEPISGVFNGHKWNGFSDGITTWKHFRIPWKAKDNPEYTDSEIKYDISKYAEAIGMTGWDWKNKQSRWVGFDFDSLIGHRQGLTSDELKSIERRIGSLPFVTIVTSTSGNGLHIYVSIQSKQEIRTHTEHAAVARSILAKISGLTGLELEAKVDTLGGNMWVWHRNAKPSISYDVIKQATESIDIPANWQEYLAALTHSKRPVTDVDGIVAAKQRLELNDEHIKLLQWFENSNSLFWFDDTKQMLVCHTYDLKKAHKDLRFRGLFDTISVGRDQGHDQNCFCFPSINGSWIIRRHTRGIKETLNWFTDSGGWTTCYYNRAPTLNIASRTSSGSQGERGYSFKSLLNATDALRAMEFDCQIPESWKNRPATIEETKDNKIKLIVEGNEYDEHPDGWVKNKSKWEKYFCNFKSGQKVLDELELPDELLRHITSNEMSLGWFLNSNNGWIELNRGDLISVLLSKGYKQDKINRLMGIAVSQNWRLVNKPFQLEYPGNREWNKNSAQLRFKPEKGLHPTWDKVLEHCGECLNANYNYLLQWCAALIQCPGEPLPYLFFTGPQGCGKSTFHECLSLLFTTGYSRADSSLINPSGFNGELAGAVICVVEETNLSKKGSASDRIKDWVTGRTLNIHIKGRTPYLIPNTTHWIQCANSIDYCPILPGDTRITLLNLKQLDTDIPKRELMQKCEQEAAAFLYTLVNTEIPDYGGRLRIPVVETDLKISHMDENESELIKFIKECVHNAPGYCIKFLDFYTKFQQFLPSDERGEWSNKRVAKELPFIKGRYNEGGYQYIGNIDWQKPVEGREKFKLIGGKLVYATI